MHMLDKVTKTAIELPDWIDEVQPEDLENVSELSKEIAEVLGVPFLVRLSLFAGGSTVYIPVLDQLYRAVRDRQIREEFNGFNWRELARKHGLTERRVRMIIKSTRECAVGLTREGNGYGTA